ncbi:MAG: nitrogen regulation protein NR(II) [Nevskiaceae bacterium]|nr:MAG: nitrogen regulation protein NR(II) [Nevskiaceae bacterium]TBR72763.1 MAG: nitrogen regulation protein NR(II) [Nevskiaceae bacterium]
MTESRTVPDAILDGLTVAVIAVDSTLRVTYVNAACERMFAVTRRHVLDRPLAVAISHLDVLGARLSAALAQGAGFIEHELRLERHGQTPITVDCTATPLAASGAGLLLEMAALDRHLSVSRDALRAVQQETSRALVRGLAHEIKNPLGGIRGAAQLLERTFAADSGHHEYTQVIIREVDRLRRLVDRMLGPDQLPRPRAMNIHEVVERVYRLVVAEASPAVRVWRDYDPSIPELVADPEQLVQVVLNIARNALQALTGRDESGHDAGALGLRTRVRRQLTLNGVRHALVVQVDVEDDGPGVPPALQEKLFYPMVTGRAGGTGLGLSVAQYLVLGHGGAIECRSQPGCTVFSVLLPLVPPR